MSWLKITEYVLDYKPETTGVVYFITEDGTRRKTPPLRPEMFTPLCMMLQNPILFETEAHIFRNLPEKIRQPDSTEIGFSEEDFKSFEI